MTAFEKGLIIGGRYRVERELGQGGMGVVVAARHLELGQLFAIKFLSPNDAGRREAVERFLREARAAARLKSEHVARVHDVGRLDNGVPYMVMEYLDGRDLKSVLERGAVEEALAVEFVLQVCAAMKEAHGLGIIHRDLKPANLFLVKRSEGGPCVKVLDFGISKDLNEEDLDLTKTTASFGSALYMSPEQMHTTKTVDARTDIWALGVILYELLTGRPPFKGSTRTEVIALVLQEEPMPPRLLSSGLSPAIEAIVLRCLSKRKEERYASVSELESALREVMNAKNRESSGAKSAIAQMVPEVKATQEKAGHLIAAGAASASRVGLGDATAQSWGQTGNVATGRRSRRRRLYIGMVVFAVMFVGTAFWVWQRSSMAPVAATNIVPTVSASSLNVVASADSPPKVVVITPLPVTSVYAPLPTASTPQMKDQPQEKPSVESPPPTKQKKAVPPAPTTTVTAPSKPSVKSKPPKPSVL